MKKNNNGVIVIKYLYIKYIAGTIFDSINSKTHILSHHRGFKNILK